MIDIDSMMVSLRLSWLKRIFSENGGTWKSYLYHLWNVAVVYSLLPVPMISKTILIFLYSIMNF